MQEHCGDDCLGLSRRIARELARYEGIFTNEGVALLKFYDEDNDVDENQDVSNDGD
jgi:hypothetical protein